jgi:hypothetical protein
MERGVDERADGEAAERRSHAVARIVCGKGLRCSGVIATRRAHNPMAARYVLRKIGPKSE